MSIYSCNILLIFYFNRLNAIVDPPILGDTSSGGDCSHKKIIVYKLKQIIDLRSSELEEVSLLFNLKFSMIIIYVYNLITYFLFIVS